MQNVKRGVEDFGESTVDVSIPFSRGGATCSIQDLKKRSQEKVQSQKGLKIPKTRLNEKLVRLIDSGEISVVLEKTNLNRVVDRTDMFTQ